MSNRRRDRQFDDPWAKIELHGVRKEDVQDAVRLAWNSVSDRPFAIQLAKQHGFLGILCLCCVERVVMQSNDSSPGALGSPYVLCQRCQRQAWDGR